MDRFLYAGRNLAEISFPLGGLGTGCVGLAGNGRLVDWEIFNRPNKGGVNGFSHFAIKAERDGQVLDARALQSDLHPPFTGEGARDYAGFGFGPRRETTAGLPHFRDSVFRGEFPFATIDFRAPRFPGRARLTAFNPLIPHEEEKSGVPAAFFEIEIRNPTKRPVLYTIAATLGNPLPGENVHRFARTRDGLRLLRLGTDGLAPEDPKYGDLTLATDAEVVETQLFWLRGSWFDSLERFWNDFASPGPMPSRTYPPVRRGAGNQATLAARLETAPGETRRVRFVIAWNFPNATNYWNADPCSCTGATDRIAQWRNWYATRWRDSSASARYALREWDGLRDDTTAFKRSLFASTIPGAALEAVSANLSILKSPTVMRLEDGTLYGWEGCMKEKGCCEGSCTHVWNYAQALPFMFPKLERSMREADFAWNQEPSGAMAFRLKFPLGEGRWAFRACVDGQFGGVLKAYRDWRVCGDSKWLRRLWPAIRKALEYAWSPENPDRWDPEKTGVLQGRQHHTLDMELFGPNAWLTGFYLAALKAGAQMADALGESEAAETYRAVFARGKAWTDARLFNGEYYCQAVDLSDRSILAPFASQDDRMTGSLSGENDTFAAYWDAERSELKYQIGEGCGIDQTLAQWHANLYDLGEVFDPGQTKRALRALFRRNFKKPMREHFNACRIFCLNDEGGLVVCSWPEGRRRPAIPLTYAQETQNGYEYAAAGQMIQNGLVREGVTVVEAIRERYDGEKRNPWNEFECGSNYARSMASYALLNAFSGFVFDMTRGLIGFDPVEEPPGGFRCFWSVGEAWGEFVQRGGRIEIIVQRGTLKVARLRLGAAKSRKATRTALGRRSLAFAQRGVEVVLKATARIEAGARLRVFLSD